MKKKLLLSLLVWINVMCYSQQPETWTVLFKNNISFGEYSFFYYNGAIYTANYNDYGEDAGTLKIYKFTGSSISANGTVSVAKMSKSSSTKNFFGFASDGVSIYAVNQSYSIYEINPATMELIQEIPIESPVASIAYDPVRDGFWCSNTPMADAFFIKKDVTSTNLVLKGESKEIVGLAYDDTSEGGPYLWSSNAGRTMQENYAKIGRWNLQTGVFTEGIRNIPEILGAPSGGNYAGSLFMAQDISSGKQLLFGTLASKDLLYAYDMKNTFDVASPEKVRNLVLTPNANGSLSATLTWKNPEKSLKGDNLTGLSKIYIYRSNLLVDSLSNPQVGASVSWQDTAVSISQFYTYKVVAANSAGKGVPTVRTDFVGLDFPKEVENPAITKENDHTAKISWSAPTEGANGGWLNPSALTYKLVRIPDNVVVVEDCNATNYTDSTITSLGIYSYAITAKNATGESKSATTNKLTLGIHIFTPWMESFNTANNLPLWTIIDNNHDGAYWLRNPYSGGGAMQYIPRYPYENGSDDWLISPPIWLEQGKSYRLQWNHNTPSIMNDAIEYYEVRMGSDTTVAAQGIDLGQYSVVYTGGYITNTKEISVSTTGKYHFAWHCAEEKYIETSGLLINNISIVEMVKENDLAAVSIAGTHELNLDLEGTFTVKVKNEGHSPQNNYSVGLLVYKNGALIDKKMVANTETLDMGAEKTFTISFKHSESGNLELRGLVALENDDDHSNDTTAVHALKILDKGVDKVMIGDPNTHYYYELAPFNCLYPHGVAQSLYYEDEINRKGLITGLEYYYSFMTESVYGKAVKIYMTTTQKDDLYEGWITENLTLVYDGTIDLPIENRSILIPLQQPFVYNGGNLMVFTLGSYGKSYQYDQFLYTESDRRRVRVDADLYEPFVDFNRTGRALERTTNVSLAFNTNGASVSGTITNAGEPIENVSVEIQELHLKVATDAQGKFKFDFVPANATFTVVASKAGYRSETQTRIMTESDFVLDMELADDCTVNPVRNLQARLHEPQWNNVALTWEAPEGITAENYVTGYKVYTNHLLKATLPTDSLSFMDDASFGNYIYEVSALWNNDCESEALLRNIEMKWDTIITRFPFTEGFEASNIPFGWETKHLQRDTNWDIVSTWGDEEKTFTAHNNSRYFAILSDLDHYQATTRLITPVMDLSTVAEPYLNFWCTFALRGFIDVDSLDVLYKNTPDGKWIKLASYGGYWNRDDAWKNKILSLPNPSSTYWIAFDGIALRSYGVMLDDITVYDNKDNAIKFVQSEGNDAIINIFPNPVRNWATISGENILRIEVCNLLGKTIERISVNNEKEYQINMQAYAAGVYLLKIFVSENKYLTKRVVVVAQ